MSDSTASVMVALLDVGRRSPYPAGDGTALGTGCDAPSPRLPACEVRLAPRRGAASRLGAAAPSGFTEGMSVTRHLARLVVAAALAAGTMTAPPAAAATTVAPAAAAPGPVVYARGGDVHVIGLDGSPLRLTAGAAEDAFPAWSPDRTRIAFVRDGSLHVMRADGTAVRRLTTRTGDGYPAWAPGGRRIAFASTRAGGEAELYVVRSDGRRLRRLTRTARHVDDTQPAWTPDGRSVIFASNRAGYWNYELFRVRVRDGAGLRRLTRWGTGADGAPGDDLMPDVSPDGSRIAFVSDRAGGYGVWTVAPDGSDLRMVFRDRGRAHAFPRFSTDGKTLLVELFGPESEHHRLVTVPVAGGVAPARLTAGQMPDW
jgi:Tol biopolymer transport system component